MTTSDLIAFRRHLHRNPELSSKEFQTQKLIIEKLKNIGCESVEEIGGTGVLVRFQTTKPGPSILLRSDHDALPIQEIGTVEHRSQKEGVAHMCGHDGHTAIMLGVASELMASPPSRGEVYLLFQPSEENGQGAQKVLDDPAFDFKADRAFALHNLPGFPMHQVVCKEGNFTAAVKSVIFRIKGVTSHAAEPEKGKNPALAVAEILQLSESLTQSDINRDDFRLIAVVHVNLGEKWYGISAGYAEVHLTIRSWKNEVMENLERELVERVTKICDKYDMGLETEWLEVFHANENDHESFDKIRQSAVEAGLDFKVNPTGFKWGEDFGLFTSRFGGAMFGIGSGEDSPALHNPDYDFPDEIIETGVSVFTGIVKKYNQ